MLILKVLTIIFPFLGLNSQKEETNRILRRRAIHSHPFVQRKFFNINRKKTRANKVKRVKRNRPSRPNCIWVTDDVASSKTREACICDEHDPSPRKYCFTNVVDLSPLKNITTGQEQVIKEPTKFEVQVAEILSKYVDVWTKHWTSDLLCEVEVESACDTDKIPGVMSF